MPATLNLARLSDHELLASAQELARQERILNIQIIDHLTEIAARGLHVRHGYSSLFAYAVKELGFSEGAAHYRIQAKKLCADYPEVKQQLEEGTLTLTGAGQLQSAFDRHARRRRQRAREERRRESSGASAAGGAGAVGGVSGLGAPDGVAGWVGRTVPGLPARPQRLQRGKVEPLEQPEQPQQRETREHLEKPERQENRELQAQQEKQEKL